MSLRRPIRWASLLYEHYIYAMFNNAQRRPGAPCSSNAPILEGGTKRGRNSLKTLRGAGKITARPGAPPSPASQAPPLSPAGGPFPRRAEALEAPHVSFDRRRPAPRAPRPSRPRFLQRSLSGLCCDPRSRARVLLGGLWLLVLRALRRRLGAAARPPLRPDDLSNRGARDAKPHLEPFDALERHSMLELEPPEHTRLRNLVNRAFVSRRIERLWRRRSQGWRMSGSTRSPRGARPIWSPSSPAPFRSR